jgi:C-terminal processing protease CtpA/Prc
MVTNVTAGSVADAAGVCVDDYIVAFTVHGVTTQGFVAGEVITALGTVEPGQTVGLTIRRQARNKPVSNTVAAAAATATSPPLKLKVRLPKLN